jgi:hypothetical protein
MNRPLPALNYLEENIAWALGADPIYPYVGDFEGDRWRIRLNDFPDSPLYTLLINDDEVLTLNDWPSNWKRPTSLPESSR